jgi:hypothetical protein
MTSDGENKLEVGFDSQDIVNSEVRWEARRDARVRECSDLLNAPLRFEGLWDCPAQQV